jgi:hypothetical protein
MNRREYDELLEVLGIVAADIAAELTLEQRLRLAHNIRLRAFIEDDDGLAMLDRIATTLECHGLSMDSDKLDD